MDKSWYYAKDGSPIGPVAFPVLKQMAAIGQLAPDDLVWAEGMADWVPARTVTDLFGPASPYAPPVVTTFSYGLEKVRYAGFWKRFAAAIIDGIILAVAAFPINMLGNAFPSTLEPSEEVLILAAVVSLISACVQIVINWLYYACMESSHFQGTLGKLALGIKVTDYYGKRISFGRATGRHFAKILSYCTLHIGFLMAAFTEKKQALHDMVAGCLVVNR